MLYEQLKETLKSKSPDIEAIENFWNNYNLEQEYIDLQKEATKEDFWQNPEQATISKALQKIKTIRDQYIYIIKEYKELNEILDLFQDDLTELEKLTKEINQLAKNIHKLKINLLLSDEQDQSNCFLSINAGAGGTESQDWAEMLLRMYIRFCESENLKAQVVDYQAGEEAGVKSTTLLIKGKSAYGLLKSEQGIHRLVRISPFDASKRRHTSFAAVTVIPEVEEIEITIDPKDLRIDTFRAGGAGGQHVNKTESAIRITHIPTNTVVQCQNERSQAQNKETALKMLKSRLYQKQEEEQAKQKKSIVKKKIEWGSQIRSYVLHPYKMVKDHRTGVDSTQPENVLDGNIIKFIESYLTQYKD